MSTLFEADLKTGTDPEMELDSLESDPEFEALQALENFPGLEGEQWGDQREFEGGDFEADQELEDEVDLEDQNEMFLGPLLKRVSAAVRRAAPRLKQIAGKALPMVAGAVGGPLGGILGNVASQALGEGEFEGDPEADQMLDQEESATRISGNEAMAEYLASVAANANTEAEADAMAAAAAMVTLSAADRRALRDVLPHLVRGVAVLTRLLRRSPETKAIVRVIPAVVRRTVKVLRRKPQVVRKPAVAKALATQTRSVLRNPQRCAKAIAKNVRAARATLQQKQKPAAPKQPARTY